MWKKVKGTELFSEGEGMSGIVERVQKDAKDDYFKQFEARSAKNPCVPRTVITLPSTKTMGKNSEYCTIDKPYNLP